MSSRVIVADAGPLIGLARVDGLWLLGELFDVVYVPDAVISEVGQDAERPGARAILQALRKGMLTAPSPPIDTDYRDLLERLDPGEAQAIAIARSLRLAILLDEKRSRNVARSLNLTVIGTGAVLIAGKRAGLIDAVAP